MEFNWKDWSLGNRIIFSSAIIAVLSLLLPWADMGLVTINGFGQQGYILLIFYVYPIYKLLNSKPIKSIYGLLSSLLAIITSISFAFSKTVEVFNTSMNVSGSGLVLFILASIALTIGVYMSKA
ncbi:MAG: hypothetical protein ACPGKT_04375 [Hyphomicrobiales bacterium]